MVFGWWLKSSKSYSNRFSHADLFQKRLFVKLCLMKIVMFLRNSSILISPISYFQLSINIWKQTSKVFSHQTSVALNVSLTHLYFLFNRKRLVKSSSQRRRLPWSLQASRSIPHRRRRCRQRATRRPICATWNRFPQKASRSDDRTPLAGPATPSRTSANGRTSTRSSRTKSTSWRKSWSGRGTRKSWGSCSTRSCWTSLAYRTARVPLEARARRAPIDHRLGRTRRTVIDEMESCSATRQPIASCWARTTTSHRIGSFPRRTIEERAEAYPKICNASSLHIDINEDTIGMSWTPTTTSQIIHHLWASWRITGRSIEILLVYRRNWIADVRWRKRKKMIRAPSTLETVTTNQRNM